MSNNEQLKEMVKKKYAEIAVQDKETNAASCCGSGCCSTEVYNIMADDYTTIEGYNADADLGLGCGLPTEFAKIKEGDVVIDLGSGAGNDAFIARHQTGEKGKVIGVDFTPAMIEKAQANAEKMGYNNVEFRLGDIERLPITANVANVVVSNCVLNLVPDKEKVFKEIFRVLKNGGHFCISDVVLEGNLPPQLKEAAQMYAGCVSGAIQKTAYLALASAAGFAHVTVQKEKAINIPNDILSSYLTPEQIASFKDSGTGISSITLFGQKPVEEEAACCGASCCN